MTGSLLQIFRQEHFRFSLLQPVAVFAIVDLCDRKLFRFFSKASIFSTVQSMSARKNCIDSAKLAATGPSAECCRRVFRSSKDSLGRLRSTSLMGPHGTSKAGTPWQPTSPRPGRRLWRDAADGGEDGGRLCGLEYCGSDGSWSWSAPEAEKDRFLGNLKQIRCQ